MSRHRNVRTMNYDEYDDDDDYPYGHSVEDECISPTDAQQWIFDRARGQHSMSSFLANNRDIEEEDDDELQAADATVNQPKGPHHRRDSECYQLPDLNDEDRVRLMSCMDEIRNIVGESLSDRQLVEAIMKHNYNFDNALDELLNSNKSQPQSEATKKISPVVQEPIEKDFKSHHISSTSENQMPKPLAFGVPRFNLPTARFGSNTLQGAPKLMNSGINLSDLVKSRMKKHETESTSGSDEETSEDGTGSHVSLLPKLSDLSINSDSGVASSSPADSMFSNLTDLARHHLQSKGDTPIGSPLLSKSGGFTVPNIFNKPSSGPPPGFSANAKPIPQTPLSKKEWIVDLKSALIKDKSEITAHHRKAATAPSGQEENDEPIKYGFIDCDIVESKPVIDEFCLIDASAIMDRKLSNRTSTSSAFGSILCVRYRKRNKIRIRHGFVTKPGVVPFRFNVPSPDDVVLEHMRKFKR